MCKVLIATGIKDSDAALDFMKAAEPEMTNGNTDGIGYSAINSKNELFMEKWHRNHKFLSDRGITPEVLEELKEPTRIMSKYLNVPKLDIDYMSYGNITRDDLRTVTMHTRFATCGKSMENTHPFVYNETSLIHNGVINNDLELNNKKISTCDSESALQVYLQKEVANNPQKVVYQSFLDELRGYWAFGILAKAQDGNYMLDVIKGGASLYFAYIPELGDKDTIVFATTRNIILEATKKCGFNTPKIEELVDNSLTRFNALTGDLVDNIDFAAKKTGYTYGAQTAYKHSSFGKKTLETKLITKGSDVEDLLASDFEIIETMSEEIEEILGFYDDYQSSNYASFYEELPFTLKNMIDRNYKNGKLKVQDVLQVIEEFNNTENYNKASSLLYKLMAS